MPLGPLMLRTNKLSYCMVLIIHHAAGSVQLGLIQILIDHIVECYLGLSNHDLLLKLSVPLLKVIN